MKKLLIPIIFLFVLVSFGTTAKAQCNDKLVTDCALQVGDKATYIKEFKVRLKKKRGKSNAPIAQFSIVLSKGQHYRFNVCNAIEFEGEAVLQLYDSDKMLGSTFDLARGRDYKSFDFMCRKTTTYNIYVSFKEGKEGCAVGILSIVD